MIKNELKQIDIFNNLSDDELEAIAQISTLKTLQRDNTLFYEGEEADKFYLLLQGQLKLFKTGIKSNEVVLNYFNAPTMVAEMATLEGINFPATALVMHNDTKVVAINKEKFIALLKSSSNLSLHIISSLTKKIKHLEVAINRNLIFDATTRVCSLLNEDEIVFQTQKHTQIATLLNIAPETLSRTVAKLKKVGILSDTYAIIDRQKLKMFLEF